ncbi:jg23356, partial [Pararge aegeria aegeria]
AGKSGPDLPDSYRLNPTVFQLVAWWLGHGNDFAHYPASKYLPSWRRP